MSSMFPPPKHLPPAVKFAWSHEAKSGFRDWRLLHNRYWKPFNTITIPLLSPEEFYADALAAARDSETVRELEQTLEKKYKQRQEELKDAFKKIHGGAKVGSDTSKAAWDASTNGSLSSFARALLGMVLGWDHVDAGDVHQNFEYLLPQDHWMRSKNPEDKPFTQEDFFVNVFFGDKSDSDDEEWRIDADNSRVQSCPDAENDTVEYKDAPIWKEIEQRYEAAASTNKASEAEAEETSVDGPGDEKGLPTTSMPESVPSPATDEKASGQAKQNSSQSRRNGARNADEPSQSASSIANSSSNLSHNSPVSANSSVSIPATSLPTDDERETEENKVSSSNVNTQRTSGTAKLECLNTKVKPEKETSRSPESPPSAKKRSRAEVDDDDDDDDTSSRHSKRRLSDDGRT